MTSHSEQTEVRMFEPVPDYRVDHSKLTFQQPYAGPVPPGYVRTSVAMPPTQCPARLHLVSGHPSRLNWWERLLRLLTSRDSMAETRRTDLDGERCVLFDGHWEYEQQRDHVNGYGERWPVTAYDTARLNPDPQP